MRSSSMLSVCPDRTGLHSLFLLFLFALGLQLGLSQTLHAFEDPPATTDPEEEDAGNNDEETGDEDEEETARGLVSRRGGRYVSPGRVAETAASKEAVIEYKTFRSPAKRDENDTVPSLTSTDSGGLNSTASSIHSDNNKTAAAATDKSDDKTTKPSAISCDQMDQTSPLASHDTTTIDDDKSRKPAAAASPARRAPLDSAEKVSSLDFSTRNHSAVSLTLSCRSL